MTDFSIEYPDPEKIRAAVAATHALTEAQQALMRSAQEANRSLAGSEQPLRQAAKGVSGLRESIQAAQIGSALEAVGRTAQLQAQVVGKSLQQQADAIAGYYKSLSGGLERLMAASARREAQETDRRRKASEALLQEKEAEITALAEMESQASGTRKTQIQQEINLRRAEAAQQKQHLLNLEAEQKKNAAKTARRQRDMALFGSVLDTARAILQAFANDTIPFSLRFATAAAAGAMGAIQLATIRAQPIPQFREGGEVVPGLLRGPRHAQGGIPLEAEGGEWIFSREKTRQFRPLFEAIQAGKPLPPRLPGAPTQAATTPATVPADMQALAAALTNLKQVHVNIDEKGFHVAQQTAHSKTQYLNTRYRA